MISDAAWPVLGGIFGSLTTLVIARWQEKGKSQIFLTEKVDEIVDERVSELKTERDQLKRENEVARQDRNQLHAELLLLREQLAILKAKIKEIELHRSQAITRMRHENQIFANRYLALLAENSELRAKLGMPPHQWVSKAGNEG